MVKLFKYICVIFLLSLLVSCKSDNSQSDIKCNTSNFDCALKLFDEYKYTEVVRFLNEESEDYNDIEEEYILLSKAYFNLGEYYKAVNTIFKSLDETNGEKTHSFIKELELGYEIFNEKGINDKRIYVSLGNDLYNHSNKRSYYLGNIYGLETTFNNYKFDLSKQYGDVMILEMDKVNNENRFIVYEEANSRKNTIYSNVTINFKDDLLDTFEININIDATLKPLTKIYNNEFKLTYYYEESLEYPNLTLPDIYEVECTYHNNGALASLSRQGKRCLSRKENIDIIDNIIKSDDFKDRNYYVEDETYEYRFSDDGCLLSNKEYSFNNLLRYEELTYDNKGALIIFERINLVYDNPYFPDCKYTYEYNEDGYLIKENVVDPDVFGDYGDYTTYVYNDDYSKATVTTFHPNNNLENEVREIIIDN